LKDGGSSLNMDIIYYVVPPLSVLAGVFVSEVFNRWKRREQFSRILFEKRLEAYSHLCGLHANLVGEVIRALSDKELPKHVVDGSDGIITFSQANYLIISEKVHSIVTEFRQGFKDDLFIVSDIHKIPGRIIPINNRLKKQCRKELGLKSLEKNVR